MRYKTSIFRVLLVLFAVGILSGCASSMMIRADTLIQPGPDYAVVNFLRPSVFGGAIKFGVWDSENFIGVLTPKSYIQYKATPGEHIFMARAENWAVIKANVVAGRTYYILGAPRMGVWRARVGLEVIRPDDLRLDKWMRGLKPTMVDPAKREAYVQQRIDSVRQAVENVKNGSAEYTVMKPDEGK